MEKIEKIQVEIEKLLVEKSNNFCTSKCTKVLDECFLKDPKKEYEEAVEILSKIASKFVGYTFLEEITIEEYTQLLEEIKKIN